MSAVQDLRSLTGDAERDALHPEAAGPDLVHGLGVAWAAAELFFLLLLLLLLSARRSSLVCGLGGGGGGGCCLQMMNSEKGWLNYRQKPPDGIALSGRETSRSPPPPRLKKFRNVLKVLGLSPGRKISQYFCFLDILMKRENR